MILGLTSSRCNARLIEIRQFLQMLRSVEVTDWKNRTGQLRVMKGLFFVHLYGTLEFAVLQSVRESIGHLNSRGLMFKDLRPELLGLGLNAQCDSLGDVGPSKKWEKRHELFKHVNASLPVTFDDSVVLTSGRNVDGTELDSIWTAFGLSTPSTPSPSARQRLTTLVQNRNSIAHGNESPGQVGGRYSVNDLNIYLSDIDLTITHIVLSLEKYLDEEGFRI